MGQELSKKLQKVMTTDEVVAAIRWQFGLGHIADKSDELVEAVVSAVTEWVEVESWQVVGVALVRLEVNYAAKSAKIKAMVIKKNGLGVEVLLEVV
jgi:hypothetical protein